MAKSTEKQLATRYRAQCRTLKKEIERLEDKSAALQDELLDRRGDADDVGELFAALCRALDHHLPFAHLPIDLQLDFEAMAERLGVVRPWCARALNGRNSGATASRMSQATSGRT